MTAVFTEVRRVLRPDGVCWLNVGDSYNARLGQRKSTDKAGEKQATSIGSVELGSRFVDSLKPKDMCGIPWRLALSLQADGWYLRSDVIWAKPNPMPESVKDRPTRAHEYLFLLTKSARYWYDAEAVKQPGTNRRAGNKSHRGEQAYRDGDRHFRKSVGLCKIEAAEVHNIRSWWELPTEPTPEAHFATYPIRLAERCILAGCPEGGLVLDPFTGAGTTWMAALKHGRRFVGIELKAEYIEIAEKRIGQKMPLLAGGTADVA